MCVVGVFDEMMASLIVLTPSILEQKPPCSPLAEREYGRCKSHLLELLYFSYQERHISMWEYLKYTKYVRIAIRTR